MHARRIIAASLMVGALTAALGVSGCGVPSTATVPAPLDPANKARDAAGAANTAINGVKSDVASNTPGK